MLERLVAADDAVLKSIVGFAFVDKNQAQTAGARHNKPYIWRVLPPGEFNGVIILPVYSWG